MAQRVVARRRVKVSVTVEPDLLRAVDAFVEAHAGVDRSRVFDEALYLWYARQQEEAMEAQFAAVPSPEEREERVAWRRIQAAAAERIFRRRDD